VRSEGRHLGQRSGGRLADQIDQRLAQAQGPHYRCPPSGDEGGSCALTSQDVILAGGWAAISAEEHTIEVAGAPVFYRGAAARGAATLYLHSVPTSSDDWVEFLEHGGGLAPDLPGFGRSGKAGNLDYSLGGYVEFVERFLAQLGVQRVALAGHGWGGAIALALTRRHPELVDRLAIIDAIPLLPGWRWPRMVRLWRAPVVGELVMGSVNRWLLGRTLRAGAVSPDAWPGPRVNAIFDQFDQGTQRAILRLHRSIDEAGLALVGTDLEQIDQPVLVVWGERDPWLDPTFADVYAQRLPGAAAVRIADAGHWPWLDQPSVIDQVTSFLVGPAG